jgi:succinate--hydroxymethylglutarate CoA-transferase
MEPTEENELSLDRALPLVGLRVLAVEQYGAGPFGTQLLADLGCEVIKIEDRNSGGDVSRSVGPHFASEGAASARSFFFQSMNRNKRSVALDLAHSEGRAVFHDLVRSADAVTGNLRGDVPAKLGLDYATLGAIEPRIVCVHLTGYGRSGARASWPGYDFLMQAEAGYVLVTGEPGGPPTRMGLSIVDFMAGTTAALALVSGVLEARRTGRGRDLDVDLFTTALSNLCYLSSWYLNAGHAQGREPRSAHPVLGPCQLYRTADGWIYLMCNKEKFWRALCERLGRPELAEEPRFRTFPDRLRHRSELTGVLDEALSERTTAAWMERFGGAVPAAPVLDVAAALDNPYVRESGRVVETRSGDGVTFQGLAAAIAAVGSEMPRHAAPALGADTDDLLAALGYDEARIDGLRQRGVIL